MRNENAMQAVRNGYRAAPFSKNAPKRGYKVWPEDWQRQKDNNTAAVEAWRARLAAQKNGWGY